MLNANWIVDNTRHSLHDEKCLKHLFDFLVLANFEDDFSVQPFDFLIIKSDLQIVVYFLMKILNALKMIRKGITQVLIF